MKDGNPERSPIPRFFSTAFSTITAWERRVEKDGMEGRILAWKLRRSWDVKHGYEISFTLVHSMEAFFHPLRLKPVDRNPVSAHKRKRVANPRRSSYVIHMAIKNIPKKDVIA